MAGGERAGTQPCPRLCPGHTGRDRSELGILLLLLLDSAEIKAERNGGRVVGTPSACPLSHSSPQSGVSSVLPHAQVWLELDKSSIVGGPMEGKAGGAPWFEAISQEVMSYDVGLHAFLCLYCIFLPGPDHIYGHRDQGPDSRSYGAHVLIFHF